MKMADFDENSEENNFRMDLDENCINNKNPTLLEYMYRSLLHEGFSPEDANELEDSNHDVKCNYNSLEVNGYFEEKETFKNFRIFKQTYKTSYGLAQEKIYQCVHCEYMTCSKSHLNRHIFCRHSNIKNFICPKCDYKTNRNDVLQNHIYHVHDYSRAFKCLECPYSAKDKSSLKRHVDAVHLNIRNYQCPQCDHRSRCLAYLKMHMKTHLKKELKETESGSEDLYIDGS